MAGPTTVEVRALAIRMMAQLQGDDASGALSSPANVEEFLRTLWAQKTKMKTTIALALLLLSLSTIAADARAYFFQCGPTKVTVSAYGERGTVYYEVRIGHVNAQHRHVRSPTFRWDQLKYTVATLDGRPCKETEEPE
jgi:hypothetical protein